MGILGDTVSRRGGAGREDGRFGASAWASARTVRRARDVMGEVKRAREHSLCEQPHESRSAVAELGERLTDETKPFRISQLGFHCSRTRDEIDDP